MIPTTSTIDESMVSAPAILFDERDRNAAITAPGASTGGGPNDIGDPSGAVTNVIVHPLVLFHILDHHTRRQESNSRVIGTLLGKRVGSDDGTSSSIEITNSFAVPHAERGDEVAIGKDFNKTMLSLHLRTNRKESVVGWYATSSAGNGDSLIPDTSSLIHEFYSSESDDGDPIHLVVDTRLDPSNGDNLPIKAYKSTPIVIQGEQLGNLFHELRLSLKSNEPETICLHEMITQNNYDENGASSNGNKKVTIDEAPSTDSLQVSMEKLYELLESTLTYVDSVVEGGSGTCASNADIGRMIADTLATVPRIRPDLFDKMFHDSLQDLLMVTYLSNLTRTQITIAEKLNASLGV